MSSLASRVVSGICILALLGQLAPHLRLGGDWALAHELGKAQLGLEHHHRAPELPALISERQKRSLPFWDCSLTLCAFQYSRIVAYRNTVFLDSMYDTVMGKDGTKIQKAIDKHEKSVNTSVKSVETHRKRAELLKKLYSAEMASEDRF